MTTPWKRLAAELEALPSRGRWRHEEDELQAGYGSTVLAVLEDRSIGPWVARAPGQMRSLLLVLGTVSGRLQRVLGAISREGAEHQVQGAVEELSPVYRGLGLSIEEASDLVGLLRQVATLRAIALTAVRLYHNEDDLEAWEELHQLLTQAGLLDEAEGS